MKSFLGLALGVMLLSACESRPIYRANAKLFVSVASGATSGELGSANENAFYETAIAVMQSAMMMQRVQGRLHKIPAEMRDNLAALKVTRLGGADLIVITVDSPSQAFARDCANALCDEYLKFRNEERAKSQESALLGLTREINRLSQELKAANARIVAFEREHGTATNADVPELRLLREDAERVRTLYNALLAQLLKVDVLDRSSRNVSVLEYAIVEPHPVNRMFFQRD